LSWGTRRSTRTTTEARRRRNCRNRRIRRRQVIRSLIAGAAGAAPVAGLRRSHCPSTRVERGDEALLRPTKAHSQSREREAAAAYVVFTAQ